LRVSGATLEGGNSGYETKGSTNVPLVDDVLAFRASAFYRKDPGYVDNTVRHESNVNDSSLEGGRLSVLVAPTSYIKSTFTAFMQEIDTNGPFDIALDPVTHEPRNRNSFGSIFQLPTGFRYTSFGNDTEVSLPFATLSNSVSYAKFVADARTDVSAYAAMFEAPAGVGVFERTTTRSKRTSDELRLTSNPGWFEWMLGGFYTDEDSGTDEGLRGSDANGEILPPTDPFYNFYTYTGNATFEEKAVFANATVHFLDEWDATGGVRYSSNKQNYNLNTYGLFGVNDLTGPTSDDATNYLATVSYRPNGNLTAYVRAASAYRPGGANILNKVLQAINAPNHFNSDSLWNYEVGVKGVALDNRLRFSLAAYHMDWKDIQINVFIQNFSITGNAAKAKSNGLEGSLDLQPLEGLDLSTSVSYNDARIESDAPALGAFKGDSLPFAPKLTASVSADYHRAVGHGMMASVGATFASVGKQNTGFQNGTTYPLDAYRTLDGRTTLKWDRYGLIGRVDNILNTDALTNIATSLYPGAPLVAQIVRPRTFSLGFTADF
jgi:iron complex outermembrane recepter protein